MIDPSPTAEPLGTKAMDIKANCEPDGSSFALKDLLSDPAPSNGDLHGCFATAATSPSTPFAVQICWSVLPFGLIMLQCITVGLISLEVSLPNCVSHANCRDGTFCHVASKWEAFEGSYTYEEGEEGEASLRRRLLRTRTVRRLVETGNGNGAEAGFCEDCAYLDPDVAASYFPDAVIQCAKDLEPKRCDMVANNVLLQTNAGILVFVVVALLVVSVTIEDMDQAASTQGFLEARVAQLPVHRAKVILLLAAINLRFRKFVLPSFALGATVSLLLSNPLTCGNIILNGLAIVGILQMDDMLLNLFVHPGLMAQVEKAYKAALTANPPTSQEGWLVRRLHGAMMFAFLIISIFRAEQLMIGLWGWDGSGYHCNTLSGATISAPLLFSMLAATVTTLMGVVVRAAKGCSRRSLVLPIADVLCIGPLIFVLYSSALFTPLLSPGIGGWNGIGQKVYGTM